MADIAAPAPLRVSPVIKFGRWSLLGAGILYGLFHQRRLSRKKAAYEAANAEKNAILAEKLVIERKRASAEEMANLEKIMTARNP